MGLLDGFTPAGVVGSVVDKVLNIVTKFVPDKNAQAAMAHEVVMSQVNGALKESEGELELLKKQIDVNLAEANNPKLFVSGWRPAIGWVCGVCLGYAALVDPIARFVATVIFHYGGSYPAINSDITLQVLLGMLGLAGMRSYDKKQGTAS